MKCEVGFGTCYFRSKQDAVRYYATYREDAQSVEGKIRRGEIKIGKPPLREGQCLAIDKEEGRYIIQEK